MFNIELEMLWKQHDICLLYIIFIKVIYEVYTISNALINKSCGQYKLMHLADYLALEILKTHTSLDFSL